MPRVVHFEVHASDPERTMNFYRELFGWKFQAYGPPNSYWLITTGEQGERGIDGGVVPRRGAAPTDGQPVNAFICTVDVASARDSLAKAILLGGSEALPVMAIPGVGWLAYAKDPEGTIFGMMQSDSSAA
jgi:predicted enzyme related to lactoylglutathione lyase